VSTETLGDACLRVQRAVAAGAPGAADERRRVFALAIRRHVPYRRLAEHVGLTLSSVYAACGTEDTTRPDALEEPLLEDVVHVAWCPEHGLHGQRDRCFECGGPVRQVPFKRI